MKICISVSGIEDMVLRHVAMNRGFESFKQINCNEPSDF